jgi:hypothetical protein
MENNGLTFDHVMAFIVGFLIGLMTSGVIQLMISERWLLKMLLG